VNHLKIKKNDLRLTTRETDQRILLCFFIKINYIHNNVTKHLFDNSNEKYGTIPNTVMNCHCNFHAFKIIESKVTDPIPLKTTVIDASDATVQTESL